MFHQSSYRAPSRQDKQREASAHHCTFATDCLLLKAISYAKLISKKTEYKTVYIFKDRTVTEQHVHKALLDEMKERKRNEEDIILFGSKIIRRHISIPVDDRPSECKDEQSVSLVVICCLCRLSHLLANASNRVNHHPNPAMMVLRPRVRINDLLDVMRFSTSKMYF